MSRIITLTTDFGTSDGFVGTMKGVILNIDSHATIVDITHEVAPQDIRQGAFLFAASAVYFPSDAIHVVVVDPGVGSERRPIAIEIGETILVAPDNGVVTFAVDRFTAKHPGTPIRAFHLNRPEYWLPHISNTFHGRDIFAPAAAHLSRGFPPDSLGSPIEEWTRVPNAGAALREDGSIVAHVQHIDRFGNVVIDVADTMLPAGDHAQTAITIAGHTVKGIRRTYSDGEPGEVLAVVGSSGYLELAVRNGSAAQKLGAQRGDEAVVVP